MALGLAVVSVVLFRLTFKPVAWDRGFGGPVLLDRTASLDDVGLGGLWMGEAFYPHDCPGCETRERLWLDIASDSSGWLIVNVDELKLLPFAVLGRQYGRTEPYSSYAFRVEVQSGCLVDQAPTSLDGRGWYYNPDSYPQRDRVRDQALLDSSLRAHRAELGCPVSGQEPATNGEAFRLEGGRLVFDNLDSGFAQF